MGGWTRVTIKYPECKATARRKGACPGCGKTTTRSRTFINTVSPFNRHPDGRPRTAREVQQRVDALARDWAPDPETFRHTNCPRTT